VLLEKVASESPGDGQASDAEAGSVATDLEPAALRIADFGLAKIDAEEIEQTRSGMVLGTPAYMAPEQAEGGRAEIGVGSDIYALGAILYQLLTGRTAFRGETLLETLQAVRKEEPLPPRKLCREVPHDLEAICLKCLEKSPQRRFPTASALARDLERFLDGRPVQARYITGRERLWRW